MISKKLSEILKNNIYLIDIEIPERLLGTQKEKRLLEGNGAEIRVYK